MMMSYRNVSSVLALTTLIVSLFASEGFSQTRPPKQRQPARLVADLKKEATSVANNYWNQRFTKCGELVMWASLLQASGGGNFQFVFFVSKDVPAIVVEEVPRDAQERTVGSTSHQFEWIGTSRISIKSAHDIHPATSPIRSTLQRNRSYAVTIRRTDGVWEVIEDQPGERVVPQPVFADVRSSHPVIIESCLRFGGDPNMRNETGETLLMAAASHGSEYAVAALLDQDADVNLKNRDGWTASYLARLQNHQRVANLLDSAQAVCEGPVKSVCERFPVAPVGTGTIIADPLLVPPDPRVKTIKPGSSARTDNSTRVRFLDKPQAEYTEEARRYQISGTVVLRVVFLASGAVGRIIVLRGLPYGLTERAIAAARKIKFAPSTLDGRPVDKETQVEYNFGPP